MSERVTKAQVSAAANQLIHTATRAGLFSAHDTYALDAGSPLYGRAWRLYGVDAHGLRYSLSFAGFNGYLGDSAREARNTLDAIRDTLHAVIDAQRAEAAALKAREVKLSAAYDEAMSINGDEDMAGQMVIDAVCDFLARNDEYHGKPRPAVIVADLDGSPDAASWVQVGYVLDADDVAWIRSLRLPAVTE